MWQLFYRAGWYIYHHAKRFSPWFASRKRPRVESKRNKPSIVVKEHRRPRTLQLFVRRNRLSRRRSMAKYESATRAASDAVLISVPVAVGTVMIGTTSPTTARAPA